MACPLLVVTGHRLVVAGADDDAHGVGGLHVLRVVGIESPAPHGRPQEVTLQAEYQFEHLLVETVVAVVGAERVLDPRRQAGCLVVEEDAAIAHGGFAVGVFAALDVCLAVLLDGHVGPVVPGRHAQLLRQLVDAVDRAALVAAGNDNLLADGLDDVLLQAAFQVGQHALLHPLVNLAVHADGAHEDGRLVGQRRWAACYAADVGHQVVDRLGHAAMLALVESYTGSCHRQCVGCGAEHYKLVGCVGRQYGGSQHDS